MYALLFLLALAGPGLAAGEQAGGNPTPDEEVLKKAGVAADGPSLLAFLRKRTLPEVERPTILRLVQQLGSDDYAERENASAALIRRGPAVGEILRAASNRQGDLETLRRAERCLDAIRAHDVPAQVPTAVLRVLALRKPVDAIETVLAYLPFAENDATADEARSLLTRLAAAHGKADSVLVAALVDRSALRRAAAGQALARAGQHLPAVRKLLADPDATVRYRVAEALAYKGEPAAVVTLIDTLPELPLPLAWQAEDFLLRLAGSAVPPAVALGSDAATRRKCRDGWQAWWKANAKKVDLAKLEAPPRLLGNTLVVLLDQNRVVDLSPQNQVRWEVNNLSFPLDVQLLGEDRLLVAEYYGNRVTERDRKGHVVWERDVTGPLAAQRLANGNTFVATDSVFYEFDKDGKEVLKIEMPGENKRVMKALKLPNGEIACLTSDARVARLDATGKEIHGFTVSLGMRLFGGRLHMLPSGRVLVPHNAEDKVVEYDSQGKVVWEVAVTKPVSALRLPNGHTLVTSMDATIGAVEFDRTGNQVWHYTTNIPGNRVTRALRR